MVAPTVRPELYFFPFALSLSKGGPFLGGWNKSAMVRQAHHERILLSVARERI